MGPRTMALAFARELSQPLTANIAYAEGFLAASGRAGHRARTGAHAGDLLLSPPQVRGSGYILLRCRRRARSAIVKAAAYIELPAIGVATKVHCGGIAAAQPELGCRG